MRWTTYATMALGLAALTSTPVARADLVTPPHAPTWWNFHDAPYWGYADSTNALEANFAGFSVTITSSEVTKPSNPNQGFLGKYLTMTGNNGFRLDLQKHFFFYMEGTGAVMAPEASGSPVSGISPGHNPSSSNIEYTHPFAVTYGPNGAWSAWVEGIAHPQPDQIILSFNVWGQSMGMNTVDITGWAFGEYCEVPSPGPVALLAIGGLLAGKRRR